jgi:hypothetical protein
VTKIDARSGDNTLPRLRVYSNSGVQRKFMMSEVYVCGEYCICWGDGGVQLYQGDEIVQHLWGGYWTIVYSNKQIKKNCPKTL